MPTIRIDEEVYSWLKSQAEPFEDTPNSVLRRLAGLNNQNTEEPVAQGGVDKMAFVGNIQKQIRGKYLSNLWNVNVVHALYHKDGTWYEHLREFPGALFDSNGYIIFESEKKYKNCSFLRHGQKLNIPGGISSIPGYVRVSQHIKV